MRAKDRGKYPPRIVKLATTEKHKKLAEELANKFAECPGVESAAVDDWNEINEFAILVFYRLNREIKSGHVAEGETLVDKDCGGKPWKALARIGRFLRQVLSNQPGIFSFSVELPTPQYERYTIGTSRRWVRKMGYNKAYIRVDVRFLEDDATSVDEFLTCLQKQSPPRHYKSLTDLD
jgi:hypothetical protein